MRVSSNRHRIMTRLTAACLALFLVLGLMPALTVFAASKPAFTHNIITDGQVGYSYSDKIGTTGSPAPTLKITDGDFPLGLTLKSDGSITGKPVEAGTFNFTVKATNSAGSVSEGFVIYVAPVTSTYYSIYYDVNGGDPLIPMLSTGMTDPTGCMQEMPTPSRTNYTFAGWYTKKSGGTRVHYGTKMSGDTTLYAHWAPGNISRNYKSAYGKNRFYTAVEIAKQAFPSGPNGEIVLVYGRDFADALSASSYAGQVNAPILMTDRTGLHKSVADLLKGEWKGKVSVVTVIGGGFEEKFYTDLGALGYNMDNGTLLFHAGNNRYETAVDVCGAVLMNAENNGKPLNTCFVATGRTAADALAVSPWAYKYHYPILLVPKAGEKNYDKKLQTAKNMIVAFDHVILLGSEETTPLACLSDSQRNNYKYKRLWGSNRYKTSIAIAKYFVLKNGGSFDGAGFADGTDDHYPDALVGAMLQGKLNAPIILTKPGRKEVRTFVEDYISGGQTHGNTLYFLGWVGDGAGVDDFSEIIGWILSKD